MAVRVGLVQINNSFSGQNYFPYSVGMLESYARANLEHPEDYEFLLPVYLRESVSTAVQKLEGADVVFFSAYVWNINISVAIAKRLKEIRPETLVVFGGPQVPDKGDDFLRKNPMVDLACHGEGEQVFVKILESNLKNARQKEWDTIPSTSFINSKGEFIRQENIERLKDVETIPSPYTSGVFDRLMAANPNEKWIGMWETNRGCPFSCAYCDWGSATQSRVYQFGMDRLKAEVDWFARNKVEFIFCADANYGMLKRDYDLTEYVAKVKKETGYPHGLSVQNTKNATERAYAVQKLLADAGLNKGVTIALQTTDKQTLKNVKRANISTEFYQELQRRFTRDKVETYSDIILALPGETYESFIHGISDCVENGQHNRIQFGNLSILPNAAMGDPEYQKEFGLVLVESPVVNIHGSLDTSEDEILENQVLVVETNSLPAEDWVKTRTFSWLCSFLYFNKVLQIPLILLMKQYGLSFHELILLFNHAEMLGQYPTLREIQEFFDKTARDIQQGGPEYVASKEWLNIWWPADELVLIRLATQFKLNDFYRESEALLARFLEDKGIAYDSSLLHDMCFLNQSLMKLPFQKTNLDVSLSYNILEAYNQARSSEDIKLVKEKTHYVIDRTTESWNDWQDWCRKVIWWGNKKGAYLYTGRTLEVQLAGHF